MNRQALLLAAGLIAVAGGTVAFAQTPKELAQTAAYIEAFQNPDGGFAGVVGQKSSLGATSSAIRVLGFAGGSIRDVPACIAYVESCFDKETGGFAPTPGGTTSIGVTASGLMAVAALKLDAKGYSKSVGYLGENAKTFDDIRIAVAALEAIKATSPEFARWTEEVVKDRNPDGSFGSGPTLAYTTGSKAVALLRLGDKLDRREGVLAALRNGQRADGGWSTDGTKSDLGASYRIMRCFFMLKERPDLDRLRKWLAGFRQSDGGYSSTPGGPADVGGTYFCSIMLHWARLLEGEPALVETAGFVPLFDGSTLDGWEGNANLWAAKDGKIVGTSPGMKQNDFLATKASYEDFILKLTFRVRGDEASNSGVQFRSVRLTDPANEMSGYQADVGQGFWGCLYDESRRNKVLVPANAKAVESVRKDGWNSYVIRAMGGHITLTLNGVTSVDYHEPDAAIARDGKIALQIHAGNALTVEFKDIYIQPLPRPGADDSSPGFHQRSVKTDKGERKYMVYLPAHYDPSKAYPAVLFLHGSGERGTDGVTSGQIGLGAAIARHPDDFPAIAVLPQAEKTWAADSDDAKAALAALDDVMKAHKVDKDRVVLTGLSMGGAGAWSVAAAHPERFSALVAVCGRGRPETASTIKAIPTWIVCGDEDSPAALQNARSMTKALKDAGGRPRLTEYRAVGHNSWDRAYNDLALLDWMLAQSRQSRTTKGE